MRRRRFAWLLLILLPALLSACDGNKKSVISPHSGPGKPAYGDALVVGSIGEPSTLIPLLASDSASFDIAGLVYNGLVRYDKNLRLEGELAKNWIFHPMVSPLPSTCATGLNGMTAGTSLPMTCSIPIW